MSEDNYDYMFYRETLLNSGESTYENMIGKYPLQFQHLIQIYTRRTTLALRPAPASLPNHAQESSEIATAQLPSTSTTNDFPIALRKSKWNCTQHLLFNVVSYSHLLSFFRSFISSLDSCWVPKNVSEALSGDARGDDDLKEEWDLEVSHTSTRKENC